MGSSGSPAGGVLYLVVGPSGVGKDTLLAGARQKLGPSFLFARRVITRPADAGGEDHIAVTPEQFADLSRSQAFSLAWGAHGLRYGIRRADTDRLLEGTQVVANVSRAVIGDARAAFPRVRVVQITASEEVLKERLRARGRESAEEVEARLARDAAPVVGPDVATVRNDGPLEETLKLFLGALGEGQAAG